MSSVSMQRRIKQAGSMMQRNFDHLDPKLPSNLGMKRVPGEQERLPKWIPPKDRVKQFNITIGDRVLVTTGDKSMKNKIGTVDRMDRTRNLVWLKESPFRREWAQTFGRKGQLFDPEFEAPQNTRPRPIHYSNLKLVISEPEDDRVTIASRLRATKATWSLSRNAFTWSRIPEAIKQYEFRSDGSVKPVKKEGETTVDETGAKVRHERVPWPLEGLTKEEKDLRLSKLGLAPSKTETVASAISRDSFKPTLEPFRRNIPELQIPYLEFGGGRNSSAKRAARWNERNRDPVTGKIVVARRPVIRRRFARINWDKPTKAYPNGLPRSAPAATAAAPHKSEARPSQESSAPQQQSQQPTIEETLMV